MQLTLRGGSTRLQSFSTWCGADPETLFATDPVTFKTHAMNFQSVALAMIADKERIITIQNQSLTTLNKKIQELELENVLSASRNHAVVANRVVVEAAMSTFDARKVAANRGSAPKLSTRYNAFLEEFVLDSSMRFLRQSSKVFLQDINRVTHLATPPEAKIVNQLLVLIDTVSEPLHYNFRATQGLDPSICMSGGPILATVLALVVLHLQHQTLWKEPIIILNDQLIPQYKLVSGVVSQI
jgi:hypothetical protein